MSDLRRVNDTGLIVYEERAALEAGTHEPAVDDFGNQYLAPAMSEAMTDAIQRRRPLPGEGYVWAAWHKVRRHNVGKHGWSLSHRGWRRGWHCVTCRRTWPR